MSSSNLAPCPPLTAFLLCSLNSSAVLCNKPTGLNSLLEIFNFIIIINYVFFAKEKAAKRIKHLELHGHDVSGLRSRMFVPS